MKKTSTHDIDVLVDTFQLHEFRDNKDDSKMRLNEGIERALTESEGLVVIKIAEEELALLISPGLLSLQATIHLRGRNNRGIEQIGLSESRAQVLENCVFLGAFHGATICCEPAAFRGPR